MKTWERQVLIDGFLLYIFLSEQLYQILLHGAYNILTPENSEEGFLLLQVVRSYVELDLYASLTMHTESTIAAGRAELLKYDGLIQVWVPH